MSRPREGDQIHTEHVELDVTYCCKLGGCNLETEGTELENRQILQAFGLHLDLKLCFGCYV